MQKSGQNFSNRSKTILFLQRVRLSKHGFFIFNVTKFETSIFLTRKCSKLLLWAPSNWSLFGDLLGHVSRSINEQQRLQKITILLFLMSSQQGDFTVFQHAFLAPIQGIKNSKIVIFCKRYCSLINRETWPNRSPKSDQFESARRSGFGYFRVKKSMFKILFH